MTPVILMMIFVIVQAGLWFHAVQVAENAAADGADRARRYHATASDGETAAQQFVAEAGITLAAAPAVDRSDDTASVTVTVTVAHLVPGWPGTVSRTAVAPVERFIPEGDR